MTSNNSSPPQILVRSLPTEIFEKTFGAGLVMVIVTCTLYGIATLQAYLYYLHYQRDSKWIKTMVGVLISLCAFHAAFLIQAIYFYLVKSYADPSVVAGGCWQLFAAFAVNTVIGPIVQLWVWALFTAALTAEHYCL
ncbi:hypothetical protein BDP27DRAFT_1428882 [Rhodocollybia butyracea]|uniref:Uncharacterized protein n=1 Tax=Rhodocollybia butyracea TaxID=206335 RepID=A0A9P5U062_9AGAR|nr:hypothetical protein BDP27DRAFT_1428882 [Rhodocollybia butyracea]